MGAYLRFSERRIEKALERDKTKGMRERPLWEAAPDGSYQGLDPTKDRRALIPPLGLREYWYPALPDRKVGRKPVFWVMLGDELVFFRDKQGQVAALSDVCPHRGASLSEGDCFYRGFVSCPYHGATLDGSGDCVAFITEGPDSKMVGNLHARVYPTRTLRGWVFVWMGEGEPAPIEEDVPQRPAQHVLRPPKLVDSAQVRHGLSSDPAWSAPENRERAQSGRRRARQRELLRS